MRSLPWGGDVATPRLQALRGPQHLHLHLGQEAPGSPGCWILLPVRPCLAGGPQGVSLGLHSLFPRSVAPSAWPDLRGGPGTPPRPPSPAPGPTGAGTRDDSGAFCFQEDPARGRQGVARSSHPHAASRVWRWSACPACPVPSGPVTRNPHGSWDPFSRRGEGAQRRDKSCQGRPAGLGGGLRGSPPPAPSEPLPVPAQVWSLCPEAGLGPGPAPATVACHCS